MQRRIVAGTVAPMLVAVLLLHTVLDFSPATVTSVAVEAAAVTSVEAVAAIAVDDAAAPFPMQAAPTESGGTPTGEPWAGTRSARAILEARVEVSTLAGHGGWSPDHAVVTSFDRRACGAVTRSGRNSFSVDRRDPVTPETFAAPDVLPRRKNTGDRRPLTADAAPDHIRLSVLRC